MQSDVIGFCENIVDVSSNSYACVKRSLAIFRKEGVITDYFHSKRCGGIGDKYADSAESDNTQSLAENFGACKSAFPLFNIFGNRIAVTL